MAELLGRGGQIASEAVNCSAPDTGNMGMVLASAEWGEERRANAVLVVRGARALCVT